MICSRVCFTCASAGVATAKARHPRRAGFKCLSMNKLLSGMGFHHGIADGLAGSDHHLMRSVDRDKDVILRMQHDGLAAFNAFSARLTGSRGLAIFDGATQN